MLADDEEHNLEIKPERVRRKIVIWLISAVAAFLLAGFLLVMIAMVIAATIRAAH
jgi:hypothetical protein